MTNLCSIRHFDFDTSLPEPLRIRPILLSAPCLRVCTAFRIVGPSSIAFLLSVLCLSTLPALRDPGRFCGWGVWCAGYRCFYLLKYALGKCPDIRPECKYNFLSLTLAYHCGLRVGTHTVRRASFSHLGLLV